jgi:hypothetical protein
MMFADFLEQENINEEQSALLGATQFTKGSP